MVGFKMKKFTPHIFLTLLVLIALNGLAQSGFYIPKKGKVYLKGDTATVFSNVINAGQLGVGKNAVLNFKGRRWENDIFATIVDETESTAGLGGEIIFLLPDETLSSLIDQQQFIIGGYNAATRTGAAFTHLRVSNPWGIKLDGSSAKVRLQLKLDKGKVFLNNNTLVIGDGNPGLITGYNEDRYIVSGGGLLLREKVTAADGAVHFPIGANEFSYTPVAMRLKSNNPDDLFAGVSDSVYSNATFGSKLVAGSVNKTWQVGKLLRPNEDQVELTFQHLVKDEGSIFKTNRHLSYISQFVSGRWDKNSDKSLPVSPGNITTGRPISNAARNTATFSGTIGTSAYFTKFVDQFADTLKYQTHVWFNAARKDFNNVNVFWTTKPEMSVKYFVIQRKLSNEQNFKNIDTLASLAPNGISFSYLNYNTVDPNNYQGLSYYRLMWVSYSGDQFYSQIVPVGNKAGRDQIMVWPNPARGKFYIGLSNPGKIKAIVIWNVIGQKMQEIKVSDRNLIEAWLFVPGTYEIGFIGQNGTIIATRPILITDRL